MTKHSKRLVLLDAHAIIHRAYHALPDFTSPSGDPTGALYGLVSMLLKIATDLKPDAMVACYDLPKPTIRHEAYEEYKGTRAKIDDALVTQLQSSRRVFGAFAIPIYEREGFEADDIIGTIVDKTKTNKNLEVVIASGDMDTLQLVDEVRVKVYTLKKGINDTILYDAKAVEERYGFSPESIPDYKGLRGDPSDNIKGVPGIGDKTATILVTSFGTLESMYKTLEKDEQVIISAGITPRIVELLKKHKEDALFSKHLATIRRDAPIAFSLTETPWKENINTTEAISLFDELGFRSLRARASSVLGLVDEKKETTVLEEQINPEQLSEAGIMLWLLSSDFTNPTPEDVLAFTKKGTIKEAHMALTAQIKKEGRLHEVFERIEKPLIQITSEMETTGVLIDTQTLSTLQERYHKELLAVEKRIYSAAGREFNVSSPKQLGEVLFDEMGLTPERQKKTAGGARSTRESELEKIKDKHKIISDILEYREIKKLLSTYIENLPPLLDDGNRLHASFLQTGTTTGRMSSQNPNLQNIPAHSERGRAIRNAFIAQKGFSLVSLDYSQIELRLAAILSGDEKLCEIFRDGGDVHQEVASRVFHVNLEDVDQEMRRRAKIINFGILYGMGVNALRAQLGTTTAEAHAFHDAYFEQFTKLAEYLESTKGFARKHGYTETMFGRRRQFPEMKSRLPYVVAQAERMAVNAPLQGTQADIIKLAMVDVDFMLKEDHIKEDAHLLLQVHDELIYEIRTTKQKEITAHIKDIMESVLRGKETRNIQLIVETKTGLNWGEMKRV